MTDPEPERLAWCYITNAVRCSAGIGPGAFELPLDEANRLVADHHGVMGDQPPRDWSTYALANARLHAPRRNG